MAHSFDVASRTITFPALSTRSRPRDKDQFGEVAVICVAKRRPSGEANPVTSGEDIPGAAPTDRALS